MARVTSVERIRKSMWITLENGQKIKVPYVLFRQRPVEDGTELDLEEFDQWLMLHQYRYALDRAVGYLAARACSRKEIEDKLKRVGYRPCTIEMVLYKLESNHLLDDLAFAEQWAEIRSAHGLGPRRILMELRDKGIPTETARAILNELSKEDEQKTALLLVQKKLRSVKADEDPRKTAARLTAMLARRGYSYETARAAIEAAQAELLYEE